MAARGLGAQKAPVPGLLHEASEPATLEPYHLSSQLREAVSPSPATFRRLLLDIDETVSTESANRRVQGSRLGFQASTRATGDGLEDSVSVEGLSGQSQEDLVGQVGKGQCIPGIAHGRVYLRSSG